MAEFSTYMWSVSDWRTDEMFTDLDYYQKGIFRELIDECWVRGSIPSDPQKLAALLREPLENFLPAWGKMESKFEGVDGGKRLINPRLEEDRRRLMLTDKFRHKRAKKAAKTRWDKVRQENALHASSIDVASVKHQFEHVQSHSQSGEISPSLIDSSNPVTFPPSISSPPAPDGARARDAAADHFAAKHLEYRKTPYQDKRGDYVALAKLRKAYSIAGKETPPEWERACLNYFASDLRAWTLADLTARYSVFYNSSVDRFGVSTAPTNGGNGNGQHVRQQPGIGKNPATTTFGGGEFTKPYTPRER